MAGDYKSVTLLSAKLVRNLCCLFHNAG